MKEQTLVLSAKPFSAWERRLALRYLGATKRDGGVAAAAAISCISIGLAVAAIIVVTSVMNGFRTELLDRLVGFNGHVFITNVPPEALHGPLFDHLGATPGVRSVSPTIEAQAMALGRLQVTGAIVRGVRPEDLERTPIVGEALDPSVVTRFANTPDAIILGDSLAEAAGVRVGETISFIAPSPSMTSGGELPVAETFVVVGLSHSGVSEIDRAYVFMPLPRAQAFLNRPGQVDVIILHLERPDEAPRVRVDIARVAGSTAMVSDWSSQNRAFWEIFAQEHNVLRFILSLFVVISAQSIVSGLVMLTKTKAGDIAILRTVGASQGAILRIFGMSGAMIGCIAIAIGGSLGVLFCVFISPIQNLVETLTGSRVFASDVYFLDRVPAEVVWPEIALIVLLSFLACCIATLPPALRAARIDPVEGLRYE